VDEVQEVSDDCFDSVVCLTIIAPVFIQFEISLLYAGPGDGEATHEYQVWMEVQLELHEVVVFLGDVKVDGSVGRGH
jgi:hypothetical protein